MPETSDLIHSILMEREGLIAKERLVHEAMESHTTEPRRMAKLQAEWDSYSQQIDELGRRAEDLTSMVEQEQDRAGQRERFAHALLPSNQRAGTMANDTELAAWLREGGTSTFDVPLNAERHDLTKGTATAGAELIPTGFSQVFFEALRQQGAVRRVAEVLTTTGGENLLVPKTTGYGTATIIAEGGAILENDPTFGQVTLGSYKYGQMVQLSRELVEDSAVDIVDYVARMLGESIGQLQGTHFATGTGTGQPQGIAASGVVGITLTTGQTTTITSADSLIDLYFSVLSPYRANGSWLMNDTTLAIVRKMKASGTGDYVLAAATEGGNPTIMGRPVFSDPFVASPAANALTVAFGDFRKYYAIRDAGALRIERSDDFAFANDLVTFRGLLRSDGKQLVNGANSAVKWLKQSAT